MQVTHNDGVGCLQFIGYFLFSLVLGCIIAGTITAFVEPTTQTWKYLFVTGLLMPPSMNIGFGYFNRAPFLTRLGISVVSFFILLAGFTMMFPGLAADFVGIQDRVGARTIDGIMALVVVIVVAKILPRSAGFGMRIMVGVAVVTIFFVVGLPSPDTLEMAVAQFRGGW